MTSSRSRSPVFADVSPRSRQKLMRYVRCGAGFCMIISVKCVAFAFLHVITSLCSPPSLSMYACIAPENRERARGAAPTAPGDGEGPCGDDGCACYSRARGSSAVHRRCYPSSPTPQHPQHPQRTQSQHQRHEWRANSAIDDDSRNSRSRDGRSTKLSSGVRNNRGGRRSCSFGPSLCAPTTRR